MPGDAYRYQQAYDAALSGVAKVARLLRFAKGVTFLTRPSSAHCYAAPPPSSNLYAANSKYNPIAVAIIARASTSPSTMNI